jgi:hypothetical protein
LSVLAKGLQCVAQAAMLRVSDLNHSRQRRIRLDGRSYFSISTPRQKAMWFFTCFAAGFGSG